MRLMLVIIEQTIESNESYITSEKYKCILIIDD